jgi:hypothetical protein
VRPTTCEFDSRLAGSTTTRANSSPSTTTIARPASTQSTDRITRLKCPVTSPRAMPRMGVPSGAMIMAPITVAVESASTPLIAMTAESTSMMRKPERFATT